MLLIRRRYRHGMNRYFLSIFDFAFFMKRMRTGKAKDFPLAQDISLETVKYEVLAFKPGITPDTVFPSDHKPARIGIYEIKECERLMGLFIHRYNTDEDMRKKHYMGFKNDRWWIDLDIYGRYYTAVVSPGGEKLVHINCFILLDRSTSIGLLQRIFGRKPLDGYASDADDGGNSYFRIKINLDTRKVISYEENGVA